MTVRGSFVRVIRPDPGTEPRAWRAQVLERAGDLRTAALVAASEAGCALTYVDGAPTTIAPGAAPETVRVTEIARRVVQYADTAVAYAQSKSNPFRWATGAMVEGAWTNVQAGEALLVEIAEDGDVLGLVPLVAYEARRYLRPTDPRRVAVQAMRARRGALTRSDRKTLATALHGVHYRNSALYMRVRSLRNVQLASAVVFLVLALGLAVFGWSSPKTLSLCLEADVPAAAATATAPAEPAKPAETGKPAEPVKVCPNGTAKPDRKDVVLVEVFGLIGGAAASARALTGTRRPAAPYSSIVAQGVLKTALGAVTAVLGVLFLEANFVPGVNDVGSQAEILVYAVVFGYAQQVLTGLIDARANAAANETAPAAPAPSPDDLDAPTGTGTVAATDTPEVTGAVVEDTAETGAGGLGAGMADDIDG